MEEKQFRLDFEQDDTSNSGDDQKPSDVAETKPNPFKDYKDETYGQGKKKDSSGWN